MPYEFFEHTADIGIIVSGNSPEEVFVNAAMAMFEIIADTSQLPPQKKIEIKQEACAYDELLVEWLRELLYQFSVSGIIFKDFAIQELSPVRIKAFAWGAAAAGRVKTEIKAVTYHKLEFKKTAKGYQARVIFDV